MTTGLHAFRSLILKSGSMLNGRVMENGLIVGLSETYLAGGFHEWIDLELFMIRSGRPY